MLRVLKIGSVCELYEELLIIRIAAFCLVIRTLRLLGLVQLHISYLITVHKVRMDN